MTFPHVDPDFKRNSDIPEYLQPEHIERVMEVNNAVMRATSNCKEENADCLECGNAECFKAFEAQAELWGMTLKELMDSWKKQCEEGEKAVEAQRRRYEYMAKINEHKEKQKVEKLSKIEKTKLYQNDLFSEAA